jgi:hypothetical protein
MPCRYCHFRFIVRHHCLYSVATIISVYLSITISFFVTRRCRHLITLPQALLESGQTADTSRMLVQLLECAVLEQVSSRTRHPCNQRHYYHVFCRRHHRHLDRNNCPQRFADASHFKFLLFRCALEAGATTEQAQKHLRDAWLYHAFAAVFEFTTQPFS